MSSRGDAVLDVTVPIRSGMLVYPGDPEVHLERASSIADGEPTNVTRLELGAHTATHIDAPLHYIDDAPGVEGIPLDQLNGPAYVLDATEVSEAIDARSLAQLEVPSDAKRVLFKTRNSELWERDHFSKDFVDLDAGAARRLVEAGVRLVGIDYLSIGDEETHHVLLRAGVVPLEGLDLRAVQPGSYRLTCLPIRIEGAEAAPARVLLEREAKPTDM